MGANAYKAARARSRVFWRTPRWRAEAGAAAKGEPRPARQTRMLLPVAMAPGRRARCRGLDPNKERMTISQVVPINNFLEMASFLHFYFLGALSLHGQDAHRSLRPLPLVSQEFAQAKRRPCDPFWRLGAERRAVRRAGKLSDAPSASMSGK